MIPMEILFWPSASLDRFDLQLGLRVPETSFQSGGSMHRGELSAKKTWLETDYATRNWGLVSCLGQSFPMTGQLELVPSRLIGRGPKKTIQWFCKQQPTDWGDPKALILSHNWSLNFKVQFGTIGKPIHIYMGGFWTVLPPAFGRKNRSKEFENPQFFSSDVVKFLFLFSWSDEHMPSFPAHTQISTNKHPVFDISSRNECLDQGKQALVRTR